MNSNSSDKTMLVIGSILLGVLIGIILAGAIATITPC